MRPILRFLDRIRAGLARALTVCGALGIAFALAACGGGGATGASSGAVLNSSTAVSDILLISDRASLPSSGANTATITAQVKDAQNNVLPNQTVTFGTTDTGATITPTASPSKTDTAGKVTATLALSSTTIAKRNRTITVTATAGGVTKSMDVDVTGTVLSVSGSSTLASGGIQDYTVTLRDAGGIGIPGVSITPTSKLANGIVPGTVMTDSSGQAVFHVSGNTSGQDVLSFAALGASATQAVSVSGTVLRFDSPAALEEVLVNTAKAVQVTYLESGVAQANKSILLTATRGVLNGGSNMATVTTNASGQVSVTVQSPTAGFSTLSATVSGTSVSTSTKVEFVSHTPGKITLSPSPTVIPVNAPGSSSSSSQLIAVVRDANDNPVKGATVSFSAPADPSNGRIEPGVAITDSTGTATAAFIAGPNSTGQLGVTVRADIAGTGLYDAKQMTVASSAVFVSAGSGNETEIVDNTTYADPWSVIVVDSNRNPVTNAKVTASIKATHFRKGVWTYVTAPGATSGAWVPRLGEDPNQPPLQCPSEDANNNNLLDAGEDVNLNGRLDPGGPAAVQIVTPDGLTGADGRVLLKIIYPKSFGEWTFVQLRVTITTAGTESTWEFPPYLLPDVASDVTDSTKAPPNVRVVVPTNPYGVPVGMMTGPYGYVGDCTNKN